MPATPPSVLGPGRSSWMFWPVASGAWCVCVREWLVSMPLIVHLLGKAMGSTSGHGTTPLCRFLFWGSTDGAVAAVCSNGYCTA